MSKPKPKFKVGDRVQIVKGPFGSNGQELDCTDIGKIMTVKSITEYGRYELLNNPYYWDEVCLSDRPLKLEAIQEVLDCNN